MVWVLAWLPLGISQGDPFYVLSVVSRGSRERELYQGFLYVGLLLAFFYAWRTDRPPKPAWGSFRQMALMMFTGLGAALGFRILLVSLGASVFPSVVWEAYPIIVAVGTTLAVALIEEALFRGWLLGQLLRRMDCLRAMTVSSALFALVHVFRPGGWGFKLGLGLGLFLLGMLLAWVAEKKDAILASSGLHAGIIFPNLLAPPPHLQQSWWAGWQQEPVSGALSWVMILFLWLSLKHLLSRDEKRSSGTS